jgi:hypothetical protein
LQGSIITFFDTWISSLVAPAGLADNRLSPQTCYAIATHSYTSPTLRLAAAKSYIIQVTPTTESAVFNLSRYRLNQNTTFGEHGIKSAASIILFLRNSHPQLYKAIFKSAQTSNALLTTLSSVGYSFGIRLHIKLCRTIPKHYLERLEARLSNPKRALKFALLLAFYTKLDLTTLLKSYPFTDEQRAAINYILVFESLNT